MNWKRELQLRDLEPDQRLEFICKNCGHTHYRFATELQKHNELSLLWLDEVEKDEVCHKRGCFGHVRLSLCHNHATTGFIGGLA